MLVTRKKLKELRFETTELTGCASPGMKKIGKRGRGRPGGGGREEEARPSNGELEKREAREGRPGDCSSGADKRIGKGEGVECAYLS